MRAWPVSPTAISRPVWPVSVPARSGTTHVHAGTDAPTVDAAHSPGNELALDPGAEGVSVLSGIAAHVGAISRIALLDTDPGADLPIVVDGEDTGVGVGSGSAGRYRLLGEIARGGMGAVLKGRDTDLGRDLALKILLDQHRDRPDLIQRFVEEAQICGQLQHPGIVPVYELGALADHRPFFTMKLVKGRTLASLLDARQSPADDLPRFLGIFEQVCQTVAYAHARGVIHRDLKPSNVMVGSFGEVQVMDWGLAKVLPKGAAEMTRPASRPRTRRSSPRRGAAATATSRRPAASWARPPTWPPSRPAARPSLDRRADVFALGSILCEILTGQPAFHGGSAAEILRSAGRADTAAALARLVRCTADAELLALARDCLTAEPKDRPADAGVVASRMTAYLSGVQERLRAAELARAAERARAEEARRTAVAAEAKASAERRARRLTGALAATILLAGGLGAAGWRWVETRADEPGAGIGRASGRGTAGSDAAPRPGAGCGRGRAGPVGRGGGDGREGTRPAGAGRRAGPAAAGRGPGGRGRRRAARRPKRRRKRPSGIAGCSTAWSTSARPRPTTPAAGSPTRPTRTPSAKRASTWRDCRRPRRRQRSGPGRPRW